MMSEEKKMKKYIKAVKRTISQDIRKESDKEGQCVWFY